MNTNPQNRFNYRRFSLRLFLAVISLFCVWLAIHVARVKTQRNAVSVIKKFGGHIRYSFQDDDLLRDSPVPKLAIDLLGVDFFHSVSTVSFLADAPPDTFKNFEDNLNPFVPIEQVAKLRKLKRLALEFGQATDENLSQIANLTSLEMLSAIDARLVTDAGVENLRRLKRLKHVQISNSQITDESLKLLGGLPKLTTLDLSNSSLSDNGLKHLQYSNLAELFISGGNFGHKLHPANPAEELPRITDDGLLILSKIKTLKKLRVRGADVTLEGINAFKAAIQCRVYWQPIQIQESETDQTEL